MRKHLYNGSLEEVRLTKLKRNRNERCCLLHDCEPEARQLSPFTAITTIKDMKAQPPASSEYDSGEERPSAMLHKEPEALGTAPERIVASKKASGAGGAEYLHVVQPRVAKYSH